ncbi:GNAT family N-acetyltransferase [candidate division KSB1 bacterium]|nr:GNAT family N-acetyltransferase [candidate division KSB1 bacterium]
MIRTREVLKNDLEKLCDFWNKQAVYDPLSTDLLNEKIFADPDYQSELALLTEEDGTILSFMMGIVRQNTTPRTGWIKLFATEKSHRRRGLATELLLRIEQNLRSQQVQRIQIIDSAPNYLQGGLDPFYTEAVAFVERRGYEKTGDTSNLRADLLSQDFDTSKDETAAAARGITIRRAQPGDKAALMRFLTEFFPPWVNEADTCFRWNPISVHIALMDREVVAFSAYDANNFNTGWFGPMGTHPHKQGLGVGGILLKRCLLDLKNQGHKTSIIPWVGPIPFYMHYANAYVDRVFWQYTKEMIK